MNPRKGNQEDEYELFLENDSELACQYGNDIEF